MCALKRPLNSCANVGRTVAQCSQFLITDVIPATRAALFTCGWNRSRPMLSHVTTSGSPSGFGTTYPRSLFKPICSASVTDIAHDHR